MYIITDIHGCLKSLEGLIESLPEGEVAFCGDLVDRGPNSAGVVKFARDCQIPTVKGNHEDMMVKALTECKRGGIRMSGDAMLWFRNGGVSTLESYGAMREEDSQGRIYPEIDPAKWPEQLKDDVAWMASLPTHLEFDIKNERGQKLFLTHAALNCALNDMDIMWNRLEPTESEETFNVFGHTPRCAWKPDVEKPAITDFYACIDTGCAYGGKLTALSFPDMTVYQVDNLEGK